MAAFVKDLDKNHLVTVKTEGFYRLKTIEKALVNPGEWASTLGSDFIQNSTVDNIDFASVHAYPNSWIPEADLEEKEKYLTHWMDSHEMDGENMLKKPVLFTEVGSSLHMKKEGDMIDLLFKMVYDKIYESANKKQAGAGALIWQLIVERTKDCGDRFLLVAGDHPFMHKLILEQSCRLRYIFHSDKFKQNKQETSPYGSLLSPYILSLDKRYAMSGFIYTSLDELTMK